MQINHWYQIENYYDGGNVKISTDGGTTWVVLLPEEDYPKDAVYTGNAGIPGEVAYSGTTTGNFWHTVQLPLMPLIHWFSFVLILVVMVLSSMRDGILMILFLWMG
ncbi:MAG: hypothetical protein CM1200mP10_19850 [Candidatus Neomarinimicrobiota bacterium]|nr:MAG: hypothetical protein CM1200mP10_19850 [Candidatus Neomarinimicrobiota bacterium]